MPVIAGREMASALDMHGCPNRCRPCWLGANTLLESRVPMHDDDLRWAAQTFRSYVRPGEDALFLRSLTVHSWFREPDFASDYRRLYALEAELSEGAPQRYELLSIWRLAHDEQYARWAKAVSPDTCQITFFGLEKTQDWFHRRRGAFADAIVATQRLFGCGLVPRWQLFLTRKLLPDLPGLLNLADRLRLRERVAALGGEFTLFIHPPGPDGEARTIEHLRPTIDETREIPAEII